MQRLSLGSPAGKNSRLSVAVDEEAEATDEKAVKAMVRTPALNRSIHLVPVLTLLCFLVLFLLSHDPSAALTNSPVLAAAATVTATARPLEAAVAGGADATVASSGVYRRLKEDPRQQQQPRGRRLGMARRR
ncbi:hypothetical protein Zm00014a_003936 [Zea mays]|uniref:Uncharacterized protein n=2 Tax=Zea mays TaxID=4577 RepID=B6U6Z2_MAIZE|nr:uncharacterized protein LOC100278322 [Zea mays]ACG45125.1 hypothetical protein [Zea mays]ONM00136.1 hypothetical protein ZEAMMB73_Zm00001d030076 [Zea mays]PWZ58499.1 hypothetical protein Zm00014a_003936 [Zea mays]|eukprot:NP_001145107.1 uncharacterized protein LOC100278322 [Zea mays]